jgi:mandelate racemase
MAIVADVRRAIGDGVRLMLDFNQSQSIASAVTRRRLQDLDLAWVKEPVAAEDLVGHRAVRERVRRVPIQTGENWWFSGSFLGRLMHISIGVTTGVPASIP